MSPRDIDTVLTSLAGTITSCEDETEPGLYHPSNVFVFLGHVAGANGTSSSLSTLRSAIFSDPLVRRHRSVAVLSSLAVMAPLAGAQVTLVERYNVYKGRTATTIFRLGEPSRSIRDLFPDFDMEVTLEQGTSLLPENLTFFLSSFFVLGIRVSSWQPAVRLSNSRRL